MNSPLKLKEFKEWLQSQPRNKVIGIKYDFCRCPISNYLAQKTGFNWKVYNRTIVPVEVSPNIEEILVGRWAVNFIYLVDNESENIAITAEMALKFLAATEENELEENCDEII